MSGTVVLADRVVTYRRIVATRLVDLGFAVNEVENDAEAEKVIETEGADIIVVDNDMGESSGVSLINKLERICPKSRFVLVVEPSFEVDSCEEFCRKHKIARIVRGPAHPAMLAQLIADLAKERTTDPPRRISEDKSWALGASRYEIDDAAEDHLTAVRRSYQQKLPGEIAKLSQALNTCREKPEDFDALREAHRIAHTLHGTAGTLGFSEVSRSTAEIEESLKKVLGGAAELSEIWDGVALALERAQTAPERSSLLDVSAVRVTHIATVLVIDDDPELLSAIELLAHRNLINVIAASNREEALEKAQGKKIDGAIIDIHLGGHDKSFELAKELRSLERLGNLPIAVMSADSSILNRVAATHAGATQFLQKPLNAEELVEAVRYFNTARTEVRSKVLIVDDDMHFRAHIAAILRTEGMETTSLGEPERILEVIENVKPDILLLDVIMPKISGFDVCRLLRSTTEWKNVPILFLTAESAPEVRLGCFQAGGDDYIEKPVVREELLARIGVRLERLRLFKERADRDGLTNLPNRRAFLDMFKIRVAEGKRYGRPLSLCLIDLDNFKQVNDTYGHLAGDRVLVGLGKLLSSRFRTVDVRGRWGGEEFAVVFYGEDAHTAQLILSRVLEEFKQLVFEGDHGEEFHVTFSCGIATFPQDGSTFDELFRTADEKLYKAKEKGRQRIEF